MPRRIQRERLKVRPILFSGPMVEALLLNRKTQTRRIVAGTALEWLAPSTGFTPEYVACPGNRLCPYGGVGDRLWVRETWQRGADFEVSESPHGIALDRVYYRADQVGAYAISGRPWRPSIFMPRWASRITLEVVAVRIERLRAMSEADAIAEGCRDPASTDFSPGSICYASAIDEYELLWNSINGKRAHWGSDPWVWVVEFKRA